jgi:hypothetical protein
MYGKAISVLRYKHYSYLQAVPVVNTAEHKQVLPSALAIPSGNPVIHEPHPTRTMLSKLVWPFQTPLFHLLLQLGPPFGYVYCPSLTINASAALLHLVDRTSLRVPPLSANLLEHV